MIEAGAVVAAGIVSALVTLMVARRGERADGFESALGMLSSDQPRLRSLGRARVVQLCRLDDEGSEDPGAWWRPRRWRRGLRRMFRGAWVRRRREEATAVLIADLRTEWSEPVRQSLSGEHQPTVEITDSVSITPDGVTISWAIVEIAEAISSLTGGRDAVDDLAVLRILDAADRDRRSGAGLDAVTVTFTESVDAVERLSVDDPLILIKLSADASTQDLVELKERTRRAWRLSASRVRDHHPVAVVAVIGDRTCGAWRFHSVVPDAEVEGRLAFELGDPVPGLVGKFVEPWGQNPVRYWG